MKKKLLVGIAGLAVAATAVGGGTFAAWTDFATDDASAGAGFLKIELEDRVGTAGIDEFNLAPGQNKYQEFWLASADSDNTPDGTLTAQIENLTDTEDGPECTTNSEAEAEGDTTVDTDEDVDLTICGTEGELSDEATVQILASGPQDDRSSCPNTGIYGSVTPSGTGTLASQATKTFALGNLEPGQGICVRMEMSLPAGATNAVQGDDVAWNWQFNLVQAP